MKVVQFHNEKYAVRRLFIFCFQYMGEDGYWWNQKEHIVKYCQMDSVEEARKRAQKFDLRVKWKGSYE